MNSFIKVISYSSSSRFFAIRSPPVAAARSARASEALDCSVPVFGNSFAPAFLAGVVVCEPCSADVTALAAGITAVLPSGKVTVVVPSLPTLTSVAEAVKKANPTATDVKVNNDGSVVVTFADGSVAVLASENVVKEATKESSAQAPAKKAGAKELPNTGTKQSNASLGLALLAAVTGGLLISKKRKEEE